MTIGGAAATAAFHADVIADTLAGAAAGFAVNRDPDRNGDGAVARTATAPKAIPDSPAGPAKDATH
jgi:hypothetical protein